MSEVTSSNALDSGQTSFSIGKVSRSLFKYAITGRYASGKLSNHTLGPEHVDCPMLSCLTRGRLAKVNLLVQRVDQLNFSDCSRLPGVGLLLSRRQTVLQVHRDRYVRLHPPTKGSISRWNWDCATHRAKLSAEWLTTGATSAASTSSNLLAYKNSKNGLS